MPDLPTRRRRLPEKGPAGTLAPAAAEEPAASLQGRWRFCDPGDGRPGAGNAHDPQRTCTSLTQLFAASCPGFHERVSSSLADTPLIFLQEKQIFLRHRQALASGTAPTPTTSSRSNSMSRRVTGCTCKKSRCLKLYCDCFARKVLCTSRCTCEPCENKSETSPALIKARNLAKSSGAFEKLDCCTCKNSRCLRKYCLCFSNAKPCTDKCSCTNCSNPYGMNHESDKTSGAQKGAKKEVKKQVKKQVAKEAVAASSEAAPAAEGAAAAAAAVESDAAKPSAENGADESSGEAARPFPTTKVETEDWQAVTLPVIPTNL